MMLTILKHRKSVIFMTQKLASRKLNGTPWEVTVVRQLSVHCIVGIYVIQVKLPCIQLTSFIKKDVLVSAFGILHWKINFMGLYEVDFAFLIYPI